MPKTAQQRFDEYLAERRDTTDAMMAVESAARSRYQHHGGGHYAYVAGYFHMQLGDAISRLPRAQRKEFRETLLRAAKNLEQEALMRTIKESA